MSNEFAKLYDFQNASGQDVQLLAYIRYNTEKECFEIHYKTYMHGVLVEMCKSDMDEDEAYKIFENIDSTEAGNVVVFCAKQAVEALKEQEQNEQRL